MLHAQFSTVESRHGMRICLVTPYDLTHDGGVNRHIRSLAPMLRQAGHHVAILGPASGAVPLGCDGLPGVVPVPANGSIARIGLLVSPAAVAQYLEHGRFDLVHVHEPYVPGTARIAVRCAKIPVVATFHAYTERERGFSRVVRHTMAWHLGRLRRAIAASAAAADFARVVYDGPIDTILNGIDTTMFSATRPPMGSPASVPAGVPAGVPLISVSDGSEGYRSANPLRLLFVGRYDEPRKGLTYFLEAACRLRASGRELLVRVAGSGAPGTRGGLANRAGAQFLGRLDDVELAAAYRGCDVFCAPSIYGESFGLVLLEAMACGRPVVASDIRGYREAAEGAAFLVPPADAEALANAIARVADETALRQQLIERGLRRAAELDWRHMAQQVISVYRAAVLAAPHSHTLSDSLARPA